MMPPGGINRTGDGTRAVFRIKNGGRVGREWSASQPGHRVMREVIAVRLTKPYGEVNTEDRGCLGDISGVWLTLRDRGSG